MDRDQKAAFIIAQAACCNAKLAAMQMQVQTDLAAGRPPTWQASDFEAVPYDFGLSQNAVITFLEN